MVNRSVRPSGKLTLVIVRVPLSFALILCLTACQASTTPESNPVPKASSTREPPKKDATNTLKIVLSRPSESWRERDGVKTDLPLKRKVHSWVRRTTTAQNMTDTIFEPPSSPLKHPTIP